MNPSLEALSLASLLGKVPKILTLFRPPWLRLVLTKCHSAKPAIAANQVLVKCLAGGVNPKDVLLRKGKFSRTLARDPLPGVAGHDIAGEVVEMGKDVADLVTGDLYAGPACR